MKNEKYKIELNRYGNVDGVPENWLELANGRQNKKLCELGIPTYQACVGFNKNGGYYKPILVWIAPKDFEKEIDEIFNAKEIAREKKRQKEVEFFKNNKENISIIAEALYSVNKEAKRQRDIQDGLAECIYDPDVDSDCPKTLLHHHLHNAKDKKEELYELKNEVIEFLIANFNIKPEGYHTINDDDMDYYVIDKYSFHHNEKTSENNLGVIDGQISSKRLRSMPPAKATKFLKSFINYHENKQI